MKIVKRVLLVVLVLVVLFLVIGLFLPSRYRLTKGCQGNGFHEFSRQDAGRTLERQGVVGALFDGSDRWKNSRHGLK